MKARINGREVELDIEDRLQKQVMGRAARTGPKREHAPDEQDVRPIPCPSPPLVIYGKPLGKPRMTRKDKWAKRKCVTRYWAWCDLARHVAFSDTEKKETLDSPTRIQVVAYFNHKTRTGPHLFRPDSDNILKGVCDALFVNDEMIYDKAVKKLWTGGRERVEVVITKEA